MSTILRYGQVGILGLYPDIILMKPNEHPNLSLLLTQSKDILTSSIGRRVVETGDKVLEWNDVAVRPLAPGSGTRMGAR
jgi:hypothetical protein